MEYNLFFLIFDVLWALYFMMFKLSIAPMIDWSYTHFRVLMKILAPRALCYTEMQTVQAIQHNPERALDFHERELPYLALQVGGSDPRALEYAAKMAEERGFSEINLNLGCPSDRVQQGRFGACLMYEPSRVAECIDAMKKAVHIPVTAKTRIGVDAHESYDFLSNFVGMLIEKNCDKLVMHARKAWLKGLSPKENRTIPPLHYDSVYRIKSDFKSTPVVINGNIQRFDVPFHLEKVDGVMLGRMACDDPYQIANLHHDLYPDMNMQTRTEILKAYVLYLKELHGSHSIPLLVKPLLNLAHGLPGNKAWKKQLLSLSVWNDWGVWDDIILALTGLENRSDWK